MKEDTNIKITLKADAKDAIKNLTKATAAALALQAALAKLNEQNIEMSVTTKTEHHKTWYKRLMDWFRPVWFQKQTEP